MIYNSLGHLYYQISTDNGVSWGSAVPVFTFGLTSNRLEFSAAMDSSNNIYLAYSVQWSAQYMRVINFSGGTWVLGSTYTLPCNSDLCYSPRVAITDSGNLWMTDYSDDEDRDGPWLLVYESTDGGATWPSFVMISSGGISSFMDDAISIYNGQYPVIVYATSAGGPQVVKYIYYNGSTWSAEAVLDANNNTNTTDFFSTARMGNNVMYVGATPASGGSMNYSVFNGLEWTPYTRQGFSFCHIIKTYGKTYRQYL